MAKSANEKLRILIAKRMCNFDHLRNIFITDDDARTAFWLNIRQIQNMDIQEHYRVHKSTLREWYLENTRMVIGIAHLLERKRDIQSFVYSLSEYLYTYCSVLGNPLGLSSSPRRVDNDDKNEEAEQQQEKEEENKLEENYYLKSLYDPNSSTDFILSEISPVFEIDPQEIVLTICDVLKEMYKTLETLCSLPIAELKPLLKPITQIDNIILTQFIEKIYSDMNSMAFTVIRSNINSIDAIYALNKIRHAMR